MLNHPLYLLFIIKCVICNDNLLNVERDCGERLTNVYSLNNYNDIDNDNQVADYSQNHLARIVNGKMSIKGNWPWQVIKKIPF